MSPGLSGVELMAYKQTLGSGNASRADRGSALKRMKGFEPSTFAMARRRSSQLSYIRAIGTF
jgi:hypothetical protein